MKKTIKLRAKSLAVVMLVMVFLFTGIPLLAYADVSFTVNYLQADGGLLASETLADGGVAVGGALAGHEEAVADVDYWLLDVDGGIYRFVNGDGYTLSSEVLGDTREVNFQAVMNPPAPTLYTVTFYDSELAEGAFTQVVEANNGLTDPGHAETDAAGNAFLGWFAEGAEAAYVFDGTPVTVDFGLTARYDLPEVKDDEEEEDDEDDDDGEGLEATESLLLLLAPNLDLNERESLQVGDANTVYGYVLGSVSQMVDGVLHDVVFTIEASTQPGEAGQMMLVAPTSSEAGYTVYDFNNQTEEYPVASPQQLKIVVDEIDLRGGSITYGSFCFYFNNTTTLPGTEASIRLTSIACDEVEVTAVQWGGEPFAEKVEKTVKAEATAQWQFGAMAPVTSLVKQNIARAEDDGLTGAQVLPAPAGSEYSVQFGIENVADVTRNYTYAKDLEFYATLGYWEGFRVDADTIFGAGAQRYAMITLFDGTAFTAEAEGFLQYHGMDAAQLAGWLVTAEFVSRPADSSHYIRLGFKYLNGVYAGDSFAPTITLKQYYLKQPIADETTLRGRFNIAYNASFTGYGANNKGANSSSYTVPNVDGALEAPVGLATNNTKVGLQVDLGKLPTPGEKLSDTFDNISKQPLPWMYPEAGFDDLEAAEAAMGNEGGESRAFVSTDVPAIPGGKVLTLDKIWFEWQFKMAEGASSVVLPGTVHTVTLSDWQAGEGRKGWNPNELQMLGFALPAVGAGNSFSVKVTYASGEETVTSFANTDKLSAVTVNGVRCMLLNDPDNDVIVGIDYSYIKSERPIEIMASPAALFRVNPAFDPKTEGGENATSAQLTNYSRIAGYDESGAMIYGGTAKQEQNGTVPYRREHVSLSVNKQATNLSRTSYTGANQLRNAPGDQIQYFVQVKLDEEVPTSGYVEGLQVKDVANRYLTIYDYSHTNVDVSGKWTGMIIIDRENLASTVRLLGEEGVDFTIDWSQTTISEEAVENGGELGKIVYTKVRPNIVWVDDQEYDENGKVTKHATETEMYYSFGGRMYQSDKIGIFYDGYIAKDAPEGADVAVNEVFIRLWVAGDGEGSGDEVPWKSYAKHTEYVSEVQAYGDVTISSQYLSDRANGWGASYLLPNEPFRYTVTGGLVKSDTDVENPVFLVELGAGLRFDVERFNADAPGNGIVGALYRYAMDVGAGSRTVKNNWVSGGHPQPDYSVEFLDAAGTVLTKDAETLKGAKYVRVSVDTTLNSEKNEVIQFQLFARALEGAQAAPETVVHLAAHDEAGALVPLYLNKLYSSGTWASSSDSQATELSAALQAGLAVGEDDADLSDILVVKNYRKMTVYGKLYSVGITKTSGSAAPVVSYGGDELSYQVKVNVTHLYGISSQASYWKGYDIGTLVDILPPGEELSEEGLTLSLEVKSEEYINLAGGGSVLRQDFNPAQHTPKDLDVYGQPRVLGRAANYTRTLVAGKDYTLTVVDTTTSVMGNSNVPTKMLVITFHGTEISPGSTLTMDYRTVLSTQYLRDNEQLYSWSPENEVSIFFDSALAQPISKKGVQHEYNDIGKWWVNGNLPGSARRLSAAVTVKHQEKRIEPGITADIYRPADPNNTRYVNVSGAQIDWSLLVENGAGAETAMKDFYVVNVLPMGVKLRDDLPSYMIEGPQPDGIYINDTGNQVLYWHFTEAKLSVYTGKSVLGAGESFKLTFATQAHKDSIGSLANTGYVIPAGEGSYFDANNVANGAFTNEKDNNLILNLRCSRPAQGEKPLDAGRAVASSRLVELFNRIGAFSINKVYNPGNGQDSSSVTPGKLVEVQRDEVFQFSFELTNTEGASPFKTISFIDNLPYPNELYTLMPYSRQSRWQPEMVFGASPASAFTVAISGEGGRTLEAGTDYTVYYSSQPANGTGNLDLTSGIWKPAAEWDANDVMPRAFGLKFNDGVALAKGATLTASWSMKAPAELNTKFVGQPAYNSAAFYFENGSNTFYAEPEKCGVAPLGDEALALNVYKALYDNVEEEAQRFEFRLLVQDRMTGDYVPYELFAKKATANGDIVLVDDGEGGNAGCFDIEAMPNEGLTGGTLGNLPEGNYKVEEINIPAKYANAVSYSVEFATVVKAVRTPSIVVTNTYTEQVPPEIPEIPDTPDEPEMPNEPGTPGTPRTPDEPGTPDTPDEPGTPEVTETPGTPGGTEAPGPTQPGFVGPAPGVVPADATINLNDGHTPLAGTDGGHWSLLNLMCAVFCGITSVLMLLMMALNRLKRKSEAEEEALAAEQGLEYEEDEARRKRRGAFVWRVLGGMLALAALICFLITEDVRQSMVFVCNWSPMYVTFAIGQILVMLGLRQNMRGQDVEYDDEDLNMNRA